MLAFIVIGALAVLLFFFYRSLFRQMAKIPDGDPHECPKGGFIAQMKTHTEYVGQEGKKEFGLVIFDGLFCSACGQRLFCPCGGTRDVGAILGSEDERYSILECCDDPHYRVLPESAAIVQEESNVIRFPGRPDEDGSN